MTSLYILLPVYNRKDVTIHFVKCLQSQKFTNYKLILIDDGSSDQTSEFVTQLLDKDKVFVIRGSGNWWWAGSLHQGYLYLLNNCNPSPKDIVLTINDDTTFTPEYLELAVSIMNRLENTFLGSLALDTSTGNIIRPDVFADWKRFKFDAPLPHQPTNCMSTNGLFMHWEDFKRLGGFKPRLLPHYTSDYEFTTRAYNLGIKLITHPNLKLTWNTKTTGLHNTRDFYNVSFIEFLKLYFSNKCSSNPMTLSTFVFLACPLPWKLLNLLRVLKAFVSQIVRYFYYHYTKQTTDN